MHRTGFHWTIRQEGNGWVWHLFASGEDTILVRGEAPSRAVAAAFVVSAIAQGMTEAGQAEGLAA